MINIDNETVIPISQAPRHFPGRPNISSVYRWFNRGSRGARLETIVVGAKRYTSIEAIQRFIAATTANSVGASPSPPRQATRERERSIRQAERELAEAGI